MDVTFSVRGEPFVFTENEATIAAEELRRTAAGQLGDYEGDGARDLADAIEERLTGTHDDPVQVDGAQADALFYYLNVCPLDPRDPRDRTARALYVAVRAIHEELLRHDAGPSSP